MPILPREVGVLSYYNAACRHCVIRLGPLIIVAVIVWIAIARAAVLFKLLYNFGNIIFSCRL